MAVPDLDPSRRDVALALLEWQIAMGADEAIGEIALDRLGPAPRAAGAWLWRAWKGGPGWGPMRRSARSRWTGSARPRRPRSRPRRRQPSARPCRAFVALGQPVWPPPHSPPR